MRGSASFTTSGQTELLQPWQAVGTGEGPVHHWADRAPSALAGSRSRGGGGTSLGRPSSFSPGRQSVQGRGRYITGQTELLQLWQAVGLEKGPVHHWADRAPSALAGSRSRGGGGTSLGRPSSFSPGRQSVQGRGRYITGQTELLQPWQAVGPGEGPPINVHSRSRKCRTTWCPSSALRTS